MDPRLLRLYNRELQILRETGAEFARDFPKIAGRLGLEGFECADPYVERLLEGFAFLASRVQLKLESEFPRFTQHLLEAVYPHYLSPTPSMAVVQMQPDPTEGSLAEGFEVPRGTALHSVLGPGDKTACEYRTGQPLTLYPLELLRADYLPSAAVLANHGLPTGQGAKAGIRLVLRATAGLSMAEVSLDTLRLYLRGSEQFPMHVYEQLLGNAVRLVARPEKTPGSAVAHRARDAVRRVGFEDDEALLPVGPRSFQGYRLLHEYFAFPQRFLFVDLAGLGPAVARCTEKDLEIFVLLDRSDPVLEGALDASHFALFCTPAINLFPKRADRIHLNTRDVEHHVLVDRTRPMDYEVFSVESVVGHGTRAEQEQRFLPLYSLFDTDDHSGRRGYYTTQREQRTLSERQRRKGARSSYIGSEVYLSLVDADEAPYSTGLRQLALELLCTNRDLPVHMAVGRGTTDFDLEVGAPVAATRVLSGPTYPRDAWVLGDATWRLISHLTVSYLSLTDSGASGAAALRELLLLYRDVMEPAHRRQIDGVKSVEAVPVVRRLPGRGPAAFGRGIEVRLTCDETAFEGTGVFILGSVLERFFARYASINSFAATVLSSVQRGEVMRWPSEPGQRHLI